MFNVVCVNCVLYYDAVVVFLANIKFILLEITVAVLPQVQSPCLAHVSEKHHTFMTTGKVLSKGYEFINCIQ